MKIDSPHILHKTEAGVVRLHLQDSGSVRDAYGALMANAKRHAPNAVIEGISVQEMVDGGIEVIVGISYDPQLGPVLLFGLGGITVEVYKDIALRRCPVNRAVALEMLADIKGAALLRGFRGQRTVDVDALTGVLVRVSEMAVQLEGHVAEVDINPLIVLPTGVKAVDALVILKSAKERTIHDNRGAH
jgi:acetyltransferase